jgi:DNA primase
MKKMFDEFAPEELQQSGLFNDHARLTFYQHRLIFPFFVANQPIYLQARTIAANVEPRWHNLRGIVPSLYNVDALAALPSNSVIYLVEGFTDTLTLMAHDFAAVGLVGAAGLKPEWVSHLSRFRVILALDNDRAGQAAADAYEELFAARGVRCFGRLRLPTDVNDFFRQRATADLEFTLMTEAALEESKRRGGCGDPQRL